MGCAGGAEEIPRLPERTLPEAARLPSVLMTGDAGTARSSRGHLGPAEGLTIPIVLVHLGVNHFLPGPD